MKTIFLFIIICSFFAKAMTQEFNPEKFQTELNKITAGKEFKNVKFGIALAKLPSGEILLSQNASTAFMPASTLKLILTAAALKNYPANHIFKVPVYQDGQIENGILTGSIYIKGIGAPTVLYDSVVHIARKLKNNGLKEINGNLYYDDIAFKEQSPRYPPFARDRWSPCGALVLNSNRIELKIISRTPKLMLEKHPNTNYAKINANLTYSDISKPSSPDMRYQQEPDGDLFTLSGTVTRWTEQTKYLALGATRPGLYFATVFKETLEAHGIRISGKISAKVCPENLSVLAQIPSPSLKAMLIEMNTSSDNIIAENLFRKIGYDQLGAPSDEKKGGQYIQQFVKSNAPAENFICADGSGLSPESQITPETFIKLLVEFYTQSPEILKLLPLEPISTPQFDIFGKSGTLSARGLNALAGFIRSKKSKNYYAFVLIAYRSPNPGQLWSGTLTHPVMNIMLSQLW
jgi:D-alanyl-D-alanine carboxypeptidase/D-alanyl-D-alanine-endopeptidase (penicillin-binding protein 4)